MTDHAKELRRHADKVGSLSGDVTAAMHAAAAHIEALERELRAAEIRLHDVATLCANVESELAEIKRRTYVAVTCNHVGRMERAEARVAELEAERAEREKQEPALYVQSNHFAQAKFSPILARVCQQPIEGISTLPLYADPPVTAPVRLTDEQADTIWREIQDTSITSPEYPHRRFKDKIEAASLRANGFDIQPAKGT